MGDHHQHDNNSNTSSTMTTMDAATFPANVNLPEVLASSPDRIDDGTVKLIDDVVLCYVQPAISVFGIIGNLLSVIILSRDKKKYNSNTLLSALAVNDMLFLLFRNYLIIVCLVKPFDPLLARNLAIRMTPYMTFIHVVFGRITGMLTSLIAVDRFIALTWPFQYKSWMTGGRVLFLIVTCIFVTTIFHLPLFLRNTVVMRYSPRAVQMLPYVGLRSIYLEHKEFFDIWKNVVLSVGFYMLPLVIVIVTSIVNIYQLRQLSVTEIRKDTSTGSNSQKERKASLTLTLVAIIYAICSLPSFSFLIVRFINPEYDFHGSMKNSFLTTTKLAGIWVVVNSSVNFIVYCMVGQAFRDQFLDMIRPGKKRTGKQEDKLTTLNTIESRVTAIMG